MKRLKLLTLFLLHVPAAGRTAQLTEEFSTRTQLESSTAIWNQALGILSPSMVVTGWSTGAVQPDRSFDIGDGSDGSFNAGTWSRFATNVDVTGQIITLDTSAHPTFQFTDFDLPTGWTLESSSANPIVIYVQGNARIDGRIECSGQNGGNSSGTGAGAIPGLGGDGRCGGGRGGNGGSTYPGAGSSSGQSGTSPHASIGGGAGGTTTGAGTGSGGGGGGAWASSISAPNSTAGTSGAAGTRGTAFSDPSWNFIFGAAGGGGGSGSTNEAGGGGGAGGGVIILHVGGDLVLDTNGEILADGGNGGVGITAGGGGGAGGGGSIQIWVGGTFTLNGPGTFAVSANSGVRGNAVTGGDGGGGWRGRIWISAGSLNNAGGATIYPNSELASQGDIRFVTGTAQSATSKAFDVGTSSVLWESAQFFPTSAPAQLEVSGSRDSFASDDSGWLPAAQISDLNGKRYLKFRISLTNSSSTTPDQIDRVTLQYTTLASGLEARDHFRFRTSGCGTVGGLQDPTPSPWNMVFVIILILAPLGLICAFQYSMPKLKPLFQAFEKFRS